MKTNKQRSRLLQAVGATAAAEATGCYERREAGGTLYDGEGNRISTTKARRLFREGEIIEAPNAGASSYNAILARLGYSTVEVEDWTSSAGDWVFRVRGGLVFQENRYPSHGFTYHMLKEE